ncbi:MAG TPA: hypothetical protein VMM59_05500 [Thermohalobaculum sp.]|nr:hypothetical protein [Thermohalobaculum sp.]
MSRRLRDAVLLATLAGASAVFAAMIFRPGAPALPEPGTIPAPETRAVEPFALPEPRPVPLAQLSAALELPLFTPSRRPPEAPAAAPTPLDATLAGVLTNGPEKVAIVTSSGAARALMLREGDVYRGWRVVRIEDHAIVLERDGRTERLILTFRDPPPAPN